MPTDSTQKFFPPFFKGIGGAPEQFETKTASFTLTAADSGKTFFVIGATAAVAVTCPAIETGPFHMTIVHLSDVDLTVSPATADTLYTYGVAGDADSVAFATSSEKVGGTVEIWGTGSHIIALARIASSYQNVTVTDSD